MKSIVLIAGLSLTASAFGATVTSNEKFIEGSGVTNCGNARIANDVQNRCRTNLLSLEKSNSSCLYRHVDYSYWNASIDRDKTWDGKRSCTYRATYTCDYRKLCD